MKLNGMNDQKPSKLTTARLLHHQGELEFAPDRTDGPQSGTQMGCTYSQADNRCLVERMLTLEDNELLAEAIQSMREQDVGRDWPPL